MTELCLSALALLTVLAASKSPHSQETPEPDARSAVTEQGAGAGNEQDQSAPLASSPSNPPEYRVILEGLPEAPEYKIVLEGIPEPRQPSGTNWAASVVVAAIVSGLIAFLINLFQRRAERDARDRAEEFQTEAQETKVRVDTLLKKAELDAAALHQQREIEAIDNREHLKREAEERLNVERLDEMRTRLLAETDVSKAELELSIDRFVGERQIEESKILLQYSDHLLSDNERNRSFAFFALSNVIHPEVIEQLVASKALPTAKVLLSRLAARGRRQIRATAQGILNQHVRDFSRALVRVTTAPGLDGVSAIGFLCNERNTILSAGLVVKKDAKLTVELLREKFPIPVSSFESKNTLVAARLSKNSSNEPLEAQSVETIPNSQIKDRVVEVTALLWPAGSGFVARTGVLIDPRAEVPKWLSAKFNGGVLELPTMLEVELEIEPELGLDIEGSPLVNDEGKVVGALLGRSRSRAYAISADDLIKFLNILPAQQREEPLVSAGAVDG